MKSRQVRNSLLLVLTAFIWGVAFVAQSVFYILEKDFPNI